MRGIVVLAFVAAVGASGCLEGLDGAFLGDQDCSGRSVARVNESANVLYPALATGEPRMVENPSAMVHARPGQDLTIMVISSAASGDVHIAVDGPTGSITTTSNGAITIWSSQAVSQGGDHTVTLEGDPYAFGVGYSLIMHATGCTSP